MRRRRRRRLRGEHEQSRLGIHDVMPPWCGHQHGERSRHGVAVRIRIGKSDVTLVGAVTNIVIDAAPVRSIRLALVVNKIVVGCLGQQEGQHYHERLAVDDGSLFPTHGISVCLVSVFFFGGEAVLVELATQNRPVNPSFRN